MVHASTLWRRANPVRAKEIRQTYYVKNREKILAKQRTKNREYADRVGVHSSTMWRRTHPEKSAIIERRARLKKYSLTLEEYENLLVAQEYKCAICCSTKTLVIDHDHSTGEVRGLLCQNCNRGMGLLGDTKESITKVLRYLTGKRTKLP